MLEILGRTCEPASSKGDTFSFVPGPPDTLIFAAMVTSTTLFRSWRASHANFPENERELNCPLNPREFMMLRQSWMEVFLTRASWWFSSE